MSHQHGRNRLAPAVPASPPGVRECLRRPRSDEVGQVSSSLAVLVAAFILAILSLRVVREDERMAIIRFGRFVGIRGPGMVWVIPGVDRTTRINLERDIPRWRSLSTEQLTNEIERRLTTSGLGM